MKDPKIKTKVKHSQSKDAWNVIGESLGTKYKIAQIPYLCEKNPDSDKVITDLNHKWEREAYLHATFISWCFNNSTPILGVADEVNAALEEAAEKATAYFDWELDRPFVDKNSIRKLKR